MNMSDNDLRPEFEAWLAGCGKSPLMWNTSDAMLAAWAAATRSQREALTRVEADNLQLQLIVNSHANMRETAQAQLAEAVGLLGEVMQKDGEGWGTLDGRIESFLARNAKTDQQEAARTCSDERPCVNCFADNGDCLGPDPQEAQGAQAGDEQEAQELPGMWEQSDLTGGETDCYPESRLEKTMDEWEVFNKWRYEQADSLRRCGYPDGAQAFINLGSVQWAGWQARAAHCTQPAEWVDPVALHPAENLYNQGFADGVSEAKRLNAVRGAEHE